MNSGTHPEAVFGPGAVVSAEAFDPSLTKAEASKRIDALKSRLERERERF
jgi:hypothetical protein